MDERMFTKRLIIIFFKKYTINLVLNILMDVMNAIEFEEMYKELPKTGISIRNNSDDDKEDNYIEFEEVNDHNQIKKEEDETTSFMYYFKPQISALICYLIFCVALVVLSKYIADAIHRNL
jgi:hypothetical protein